MSAAIAQSVEIEKTTTLGERAKSLFTVGAYRRALSMSASFSVELIPVIGCGLQALQQACGFNTLMVSSDFLPLQLTGSTSVSTAVQMVATLTTARRQSSP